MPNAQTVRHQQTWMLRLRHAIKCTQIA